MARRSAARIVRLTAGDPHLTETAAHIRLGHEMVALPPQHAR
jgi:hypothetical protein